MTECVDWLWLHVTENVRYPVSALQDEDFRSRVSLPFVPSFLSHLGYTNPRTPYMCSFPSCPPPAYQRILFSVALRKGTLIPATLDSPTE